MGSPAHAAAPFSRWPIGLSSLSVAITCATAAYHLTTGPATYTQFTVGALAWREAGKTADYVLLAVFAFAAVAAWFALHLTVWFLDRRAGSSAADRFTIALGYCTLPLVAWLGANFAGPGASLALVHLATAAILAASLLGVVLAARFNRRWPVGDALPVALVAVLLGALFVPSVVFGLNRLRMLAGDNPVWWGQPSMAWLCLAGATAAATSAVVLARRGAASSMPHVLGALQLPLPWLFLVVLPLPWVDGYRITGTYPVQLLPAGAIALVALAYLDLLWRWLTRATSRGWTTVLSPVCLAAVILVFRLGVPPTASVSADDYHFGEWLLPWWAWASDGQLPFRDFAPARGLVNYPDAACAALLGDGSASFVTTCQPFVLSLLFIAAFGATTLVVGTLGAAAMFAVVPLLDRLVDIDLAVTALLMIGWWAFDRAPGVRWLGGWLVAGLAAFLFAPGQGLLAIAATTPLACWQAGRALVSEPRRLRVAAIAAAVTAILLLVLTPLGGVLLGAWRYVAEHGAVASTAHGVEWSLSIGSQPNANYWFWEAVRTAFVAVPIVAAIVLGNAFVRRDWVAARQVAVFAIPVILLGLLYIPRAAGRIGPGEPSRLGLASVWMFAALLPVVLQAAWPARRWPLTLTLTTFVVASVAALYHSVDLEVFAARALPTAERPMTVVDGKRFGLPALGFASVDPQHLARLMRTRRALDKLLDPGETYLDMTNRNAQYFYLERRPPIESGALYNLPNDVQQMRALDRLKAAPVPVVLASADSILHDGGSIGMRTHALFRYYVERYVPASIDGSIYLLEPGRLGRLQQMHDARVTTNDPIGLLDQAFAPPHLQGVAAAWGDSWSSLQTSARLVATLPAASGTGWDFRQQPISGRNAGLLVLSFGCTRESTRGIEMTLTWGGDAGSARLQFFAAPLVVLSVDASPRWLLAKQITAMQLASSAPARCGATALTSAELWQRTIAASVESE